jgi:hypothetical protein
MAETIDFEGSTDHYGPPPGSEDSIGWLHCFRNGVVVVSAWKLTAEELEEVNRNGGVVFMSVRSGPNVFPVFVGTERVVASVVADEGKVWKKD